MSAALAASVLVPLAGGVSAFAGGRHVSAWLGAGFAAATAAASFAVVVEVWDAGRQHGAVGGWEAPLGIELAADGLSAAMLAMTAIVGLGVSAYAARSFAPPEPQGWSERLGFWPLWLLLWAALNAIFISRDVFNLYVALELVTLSAVALVALPGRRETLEAGIAYLLAALLGSLFFLLGVALLYGAYGTVDLGLLGELTTSTPVAWVALASMVAGLTLKGALFPLHFWLPPAHSNAPSPVSAALSGLVVTAAFYLVLRLLAEAFPDVITLQAGQLLGALGAAAIVFGSVQAIRQPRLKLLIAYSTVAQIGYLFIALPLALGGGGLAGSWETDAWNGGAYYAVSHACAKAGMFLAAGCLLWSAGHDRIAELAGAAHRLPIAVFAFGLGSVTLMGLPPSGGFTGKFLLLGAAIDVGQWWWVPVIVVGGVLAAGYLFPVLRATFHEPEHPPALRPVPALMQATALTLALVSIALGLVSAPSLDLLEIGTEDTVLAPGGPE